MKAKHTTDDGFVPASTGAIEKQTPYQTAKDGSQPVRLRFKPYGNRLVGDLDDVPLYQVLDGRAAVIDGRDVEGFGVRFLFIRDVSGRDFILAPGRCFEPQSDDLPEWAVEELSLSNHSHVLGVPHASGDGFVAVGIHVEVLLPEGDA